MSVKINFFKLTPININLSHPFIFCYRISVKVFMLNEDLPHGLVFLMKVRLAKPIITSHRIAAPVVPKELKIPSCGLIPSQLLMADGLLSSTCHEIFYSCIFVGKYDLHPCQRMCEHWQIPTYLQIWCTVIWKQVSTHSMGKCLNRF